MAASTSRNQSVTAECPACSHKRARRFGSTVRVYECKRCGAVFGDCYLGDSYAIVLPYFASSPVDPDALRYFDFTCLGSEGITRRHGWYDPSTKHIHQIG